MDHLEEFLKKTECPFNWGLSGLDVNRSMPMVAKLMEKIEEKDAIDDETSHRKWPLKMTYGYELISEDPVEAEKAVDHAIEEAKTNSDPLNAKYRVPFLHIVLSTKAFMIFKNGENRTKELEDLIAEIKPVSAMSNEEVSGLLAMKAQVFRYYGPDGTNKSTAWLRSAVRKNPSEPEWKISLVISLNRKRHFCIGADIPWEDLEEPVNILEELLCDPQLTKKQVAQCKYYLAVVYHDYCKGKEPSLEIDNCRRQVLSLCNSFYDNTDHPQYVTFAAEIFANSRGPEKRMAMQILNKYLEKFPNHVGVLTTACKILKRQKDLTGAAKHASIAMELGGYGAAWLLLECRTKMGLHFDAEEYFDDVLSRYPDMYKKQTHLGAGLFYFFAKRDPVNGARHFVKALIEDPNFDLLRKPTYCPYAQSKVVPVEIAYNQVVLSLQSHHSRDDELVLNATKRRIEREFDVRNFHTSRNLVEEVLMDSKQRRRAFGRRFR